MEYDVVMYTVSEGHWARLMSVTDLTPAQVHQLFDTCVHLEDFAQGQFGLAIYPVNCQGIFNQE